MKLFFKPLRYYSKQTLPLHEWVIVTIAIAVILAFIFVSSINSPATYLFEESEISKEICVHISGAVEFPGEIRVPLGTKVSDLKTLVVLAQEADAQVFNKKRKLRHGETLNVPVRKVREKRSKNSKKQKISVVQKSVSLLVSLY